MQKILDFINTHAYDFLIPLTALAVLRMIVCLAQLRHTAAMREKKGVYHAVQAHYTEVGAWLFALIGLVFGLCLPTLWYVGIVLAIAGSVIGGRLGKKKGVELDGIYREVAWELKHEAEVEAARETASHTLESGSTAETENTENKGETENG